jgi:hypothetical protein
MATAPSSTFQPVTAGMRRILYTASALVLIAGIPLIFLTEHTDRFFAWTIQSNLTAAFLGAAYCSSFILEFLAARELLWAHARSTVPAVLVFTILTLVVTLLHIDKFHFNAPELITRAGTWLWMAIYVLVPIILLVLLARQLLVSGTTPARQLPVPGGIRVLGCVNVALTIGFGLLLLLIPAQVAPLWPWALTALTARAMGAWWVGLGLLALSDLWENDAARVGAIRVSMVVFSLLQFVALARYPAEPDWGRWTMWVYLLFLLEFLVIGAHGLLAIRRAPQQT